MSRTSRSKYVSVEVDVDLDDFTDEDLVEELKSRGKNSPLETTVEIEDIYKQFAFGNEAEAVRMTKLYIEETIGRILT
jgi:hypothetical protein